METTRVCFEGTLDKTSGEDNTFSTIANLPYGLPVLKNKTKVWMVLHDLSLAYYKNNKRSSCIGSIDMMTVQSVVQKKTMGGGKKFEIITATNTYHFEAETSELCEAWVSVLHQSLALKSTAPGSEIATSQDKRMTTVTSDDVALLASGKPRKSSTTVYDELDAIPSSPTVFGVKLKSTRQSRKSCDSLSEKASIPTSPVSPLSPRTLGDSHVSKFSYGHTEKNIETTEKEKSSNKVCVSAGNYDKKVEENENSEEVISAEIRIRQENSATEDAMKAESDRHKVEKRKADFVKVQETEINKIVNEMDHKNGLSMSQDEINKFRNKSNKEGNNTESVANNADFNMGVVNNNSNDAKTVAMSDNVASATVETMDESLQTDSKHSNAELGTKEETDTHSKIILETAKYQYSESETDGDRELESENVNDDVSQIQMRKEKVGDNELKISDQYSDVDLSQVEMRKGSRSRSRGSYNTSTVDETRKNEVSKTTERIKSLKGRSVLDDNDDIDARYNGVGKSTSESEYDISEKKHSRKLDNLAALCMNSDFDEPVFVEDESLAKQKYTQLKLDAYTKLKAFIENADKNYVVEQHRKSTSFAVEDLEKVLKDI